MADNPYLAERAELASAIATLPSGMRDIEATGFLAIVDELKRSLVLELRLMGRVEQVNTKDRAAVAQLRRDLEEYAQAREVLDTERSHCGNIRRIAAQMRLDDANDPHVTHVRQLIQRLGSADDSFVYELQEAVDDAVEAVMRIDTAKTNDEAASEQDAFKQGIEPRKQAIKARLREMNRLADDLIDAA